MKTTTAPANAPVIRLVAPTAAMATGLFSPLAWGAPGDLDPNFGGLGRVSGLPDLAGPAWSVEAGEEEGAVFAGGDESCYDGYYFYYSCDLSGFAGRLEADGGLDATFAVGRLTGTDVRDVVLQADGKAVAAGRSFRDGYYRLTVFRLNRDGSLDETFGDQGIVMLDGPPNGSNEVASSLLLDADGRVIVAGWRGSELLVARLLPDGTLDPAFGSGGLLAGPAVNTSASWPRIARVGSGAFRVTVHAASSDEAVSPGVACQVLAVTSEGVVDTAFGTDGMSDPLGGGSSWADCSSIAAVSADQVLAAGSAGGVSETGFVARLQADGSIDTGFVGNAVAATLSRVTALGVGGDGRAMLAGYDKSGLSGAVVVRLQADGTLDALFGRAGLTVLDLDSEFDGWPAVHDIDVLADGSSLLAGGDYGTVPYRPFVARLLGDDAGGAPGILDVAGSLVAVTEQDGQAVVTVRRVGGSSGAVSVAYATATVPGPNPATPGTDYTSLEGTLNWADGDVGERQIVVPIAPDDGRHEFDESFAVKLGDVDGGAGLGSRSAVVTVRGDSYPQGYFGIAIEGPPFLAAEARQSVGVIVERLEYAEGAVSVTLTAVDGTAVNGKDYVFNGPVTLTWADGDREPKRIQIVINDDKREERPETFTLMLSNATGGARIGPAESVGFEIVDNDYDGGGGASGPLGLLLGLVAALRRRLLRAT